MKRLGLLLAVFCGVAVSVPLPAESLTFEFHSTVDQTFTTQTSGVFSERGHVFFLDEPLTGRYTATGTFAEGGGSATFRTFQLQLFEGSQLVGVTTTLNSGGATVRPSWPPSAVFSLDADFRPIGPRFASYDGVTIAGVVEDLSIVRVVGGGRHVTSFHAGTGTANFHAPEPGAWLLLASGMALAIGMRGLERLTRKPRKLALSRR